MVKENKFFKVPGKLWGFNFGSGKIDNLKKNDFTFIGVGNGLFLLEKGQTKFLRIVRIACLPTTMITCLPKTYRFLTLFFLGGTEGHMVEYFFHFFQ